MRGAVVGGEADGYRARGGSTRRAAGVGRADHDESSTGGAGRWPASRDPRGQRSIRTIVPVCAASTTFATRG